MKMCFLLWKIAIFCWLLKNEQNNCVVIILVFSSFFEAVAYLRLIQDERKITPQFWLFTWDFSKSDYEVCDWINGMILSASSIHSFSLVSSFQIFVFFSLFPRKWRPEKFCLFYFKGIGQVQFILVNWCRITFRIFTAIEISSCFFSEYIFPLLLVEISSVVTLLNIHNDFAQHDLFCVVSILSYSYFRDDQKTKELYSF